jgi:hypothetical protein
MGKVDLQTGDQDRAPPVKNFSGFEMPDFTYGTDGFSLKSAIAVFSPDQFEDVLAVINRIKQSEARGLAILDLCRGYLKSNVAQQIKSSASVPIGPGIADASGSVFQVKANKQSALDH